MKNLLISLVIPVAHASDDEVSLYMQQRSSGDYKDLWEFPGGKIEAGEKPIEAAIREYKEECGEAIENLVFFKIFNFQKDDLNICFYSFLLKEPRQLNHFKKFSFKTSGNSREFAPVFPPANYGLIDEVIEYLADQVKSGDFDRIWT